MISRYLIIIYLLLTYSLSYSQQVKNDSSKTRLKRLIIISSATYTTTLIGLNHLWYSKFPREGFHFFNDKNEWKQVDKVGHFYTAYHLSKLSAQTLGSTGLSQQKSDFWGSIVGVSMMLPIEVFDGFSSEYGASVSDLIANALGSGFYLGQQIIWNENRIHPKFSFNRSGLANQRPEILGETLYEEILKDYNGQTYWLSFDLDKFMKSVSFPKWLNIAIGYGASNMVSASVIASTEAGFIPFRKYYFALDPDFSWIQTNNKVLRGFLYIINLIHIPGPTLELSKEKAKFRLLR